MILTLVFERAAAPMDLANGVVLHGGTSNLRARARSFTNTKSAEQKSLIGFEFFF